ncbi:reverse transcriptase domain-containing protein [Serratia fonticola]|uniref:reverse transcriptase domain-containing protein n=1 Tax=Serratia fonticola TaxID=47917 RepID=UPI000E2B132B|nr:reverse transcriptase domain-containing protein [Serratia fonticola]RDL15163.1 reverse transcriptase (RNA-dependent DNA polymerase) [Serratia fonticola]
MIQETFTSNGDADSLIARNKDEQLLDMAWEWLCSARKNAPPSADIWDLRLHWPQQRGRLLTQLKAGRYRLSAMLVVGKKKQAMWTARDALVLKWVALKLAGRLPLHPRCEHVKGHGGGAASLRRLNEVVRSGDYPWVCRTDIKGYYGTIQKPLLLEQLRQQRLAPAVLHLLEQYLHYSVESGGEFHTPERGIPRGCALSPLMGALHLWAVDNHFARQPGIYYVRYMDDFVILTKTRWQLRRQVASLNGFFNDYGFRQHPDKTFIGRTAKGFDWMGAQLGASGVTGVAPRALANHWVKVRRFYEQTWLSRTTRQAKVSGYRARWMKWALVAVGLASGATGAVDVPPGLSPVLGSIRTSPSGYPGGLRVPVSSDIAVLGWLALGDDWPPQDASSLCINKTPGNRPTTVVDGYRGMQLAPGAVLVVSGRVSVDAFWRYRLDGESYLFNEYPAGSATIDERGNVSGPGNMGRGFYFCGGVYRSWGKPATVSDFYANSESVDLSYRVYVKPGSPAFSVSTDLYYGSALGRNQVRVPIYVSYAPTSCSLTVPGLVAFGSVSPSNRSVVTAATVKDRIGVTCKGTGGPENLILRATSPSAAPGGNGVVLTNNESGARVGDVALHLGRYGKGTHCADGGGYVYTDGRPMILDERFPVSAGGSTRDYVAVWCLLADPGAVPGDASGKMSLEVTW